MKSRLVLLLISVLIALPVLQATLSSPIKVSHPPQSPTPLSSAGPVYFIPDATGTRFDAAGQYLHTQMESGKFSLAFSTGEVISVLFEGSNPVSPQGEHPSAAKAHFYLGNDPAEWRKDVSLFTHIIYRDLYPGIDLVYFFTEGQLKSEFIIHPGAKVEDIRIRYVGIENLQVHENDLYITINSDLVLREAIPLAYQELHGQRYTVTAAFQLHTTDTYGFTIRETLMPGAQMVIDPLLLFSTYLGGSANDEALGVATDATGNTYVTGRTWSLDFPVLHALQPTHAGSSDKDVFVAKFDAQGNLVYATYYGGIAGEQGNAIATDALGNAYITGESYSNNLPLHNAWQPTFAGNEDVFVLKLDAQGRMEWATYLGGQGFEEGNAIAVDHLGRVYIGGEVYSDDFPLLNPWSSATYGPGDEDGFISIFDANGQLLYSTYISAPQRDQIFTIVVDQNGHVYAAGMTSSPGFPVHNAIQPTYGGGWEDCLILKLDPWNNVLHFATFLGGIDREACEGIDLDQEGNIYVSGYTTSPNFPTRNAYQSGLGGLHDAFIARLSPSGTELHYATFFGGSQNDKAQGVTVDHLGYAYIAGETNSLNFPTLNALQPTYGGGDSDGFVAIFTPWGALYYSSYLGGTEHDRIWDITLDADWIVHLAGSSRSLGLATANAPQPHHAGENDVLVRRYALIPTPTPTPTPTPSPASGTIGVGGGNLVHQYPGHRTELMVPVGVLNASTTFTISYRSFPTNQGQLEGIDHFFHLQASPWPTPAPSALYLNMRYSPTHIISGTLGLFRLQSGEWITEGITITGRSAGQLSAEVQHLGTYGLLGRTNRIFLPLVLRQR